MGRCGGGNDGMEMARGEEMVVDERRLAEGGVGQLAGKKKGKENMAASGDKVVGDDEVMEVRGWVSVVVAMMAWRWDEGDGGDDGMIRWR
nr:hypothetical protein [Tanacetum cinerariifolium]